MMSIRVPRVNKKTMMDRVEKITYERVKRLRKDEFSGFLELRNSCIGNDINHTRVKNTVEEEKYQTRLQNKILRFTEDKGPLTMQERHNIIQNIAKEKKGSTLVSGFETEGKIL